MMKKINWGILGTGNIAKTFATALEATEDSEIIAVGSRTDIKAKEFADSFNIKKAYGSYEELAMDPEIDVIYIAVPHTEHQSMANLCIRNKKAVLCEKPFSINGKDTEVLIRTAREHRVFLMEAMWTKFLPATQRVKKWIDEGRVGRVLHIKAAFGFFAEHDPESRLYNNALGGGALLDVGIYPITYTTFLLGKSPEKIISCAVIGNTNVDEQNVMVFQYEDGVLADLSSAISAEIGMDALIVGDKGYIRIDKFWMADSASLYDNNDKCLDKFEEPFKANGYEYEAAEVNRCLREGLLESPRNPLEDTLNNMKIMDCIRSQWGLTYPQERDNY